MRDLAAVRRFPVRAGAWLIGAFGLLALIVASVGLYGVIAYSVSRRVREIGIPWSRSGTADAPSRVGARNVPSMLIASGFGCCSAIGNSLTSLVRPWRDFEKDQTLQLWYSRRPGASEYPRSASAGTRG